MKKRLFSWLLALTMVLSMMPTVAFAADYEAETSEPIFFEGFDEFTTEGEAYNWAAETSTFTDNWEGARLGKTTYTLVSEGEGGALKVHVEEAAGSTAGRSWLHTREKFGGNGQSYMIETRFKTSEVGNLINMRLGGITLMGDYQFRMGTSASTAAAVKNGAATFETTNSVYHYIAPKGSLSNESAWYTLRIYCLNDGTDSGNVVTVLYDNAGDMVGATSQKATFKNAAFAFESQSNADQVMETLWDYVAIYNVDNATLPTYTVTADPDVVLNKTQGTFGEWIHVYNYDVKTVYVNGKAIASNSFVLTEDATVTVDYKDEHYQYVEDFDSYENGTAYPIGTEGKLVYQTPTTGNYTLTNVTEGSQSYLNILSSAYAGNNIYTPVIEGDRIAYGSYTVEMRLRNVGTQYSVLYTTGIASYGAKGSEELTARANLQLQYGVSTGVKVYRNGKSNGKATTLMTAANFAPYAYDWNTVRITVTDQEGDENDKVVIQLFDKNMELLVSDTLDKTDSLKLYDGRQFGIDVRAGSSANVVAHTVDVDYVKIVCNHGATHQQTIPAVAETCGAAGTTEGTTCLDCGLTTGMETIPATGNHHYAEEITKQPTETEKGEKTYTCTVCGDSYTEEMDVLTHTCTDFAFVEATDATCSAPGNIEYWVCTADGCGQIWKAGDGDEKVMTTLDDVTIAIDPAAHDMVEVEALAPTAETAGYTAHTDCYYCDFAEGKQTTYLLVLAEGLTANVTDTAVVEGTKVAISAADKAVKTVYVNGAAIKGTTFAMTGYANVTADLVDWNWDEDFNGYENGATYTPAEKYTGDAADPTIYKQYPTETHPAKQIHELSTKTLQDSTTVLNATVTGYNNNCLYINHAAKGSYVFETRFKNVDNAWTILQNTGVTSAKKGSTAAAGANYMLYIGKNTGVYLYRAAANGNKDAVLVSAADFAAKYQGTFITFRQTVDKTANTALTELFDENMNLITSFTMDSTTVNLMTVKDGGSIGFDIRSDNPFVENRSVEIDYIKYACVHANTEAVEAKAATCTEDGRAAGTVCTDCGEALIGAETIPALGGEHDMTPVEAKAPTAEEEGYTDYTVCSKCGIEEGKQTTYLLTVGENIIHNATEAVEGGYAVVADTKVTLKYQAAPGYMLDTFKVNGEPIGAPYYGMVGNANITVDLKEITAFEQDFEAAELNSTPTLADVNLILDSGEEGTYTIVTNDTDGKALQIVVADGADDDDYARTWIGTNVNYSGDFVAETRMMLGTNLQAVSATTAGEYVSFFRMSGVYVPSTGSTSTWKNTPWAPGSNLELKYFAEGENTGYIALNVTGGHTDANKLEGDTHAAWFMKDGEKLTIELGKWYTYRATVISSEGTALVEILDATGALLSSRTLEGVFALRNNDVGIDMFAQGTYQIDYLNVTAYGVEEEPEVPAITGTLIDNQRTLNLSDRVYINYFVGYTGFEGMTIAEMEEAGGLLVWDYEVTEETAVYANKQHVVEGMTYDPKYNEFKTVSTGIKSNAYTDVLYLRPYVKVGEDQYIYGALVPYSVREYCDGRLKNSKDAKLKTLCANLLHYGAYAQINFDKTGGELDLANKNVDLSQWPVTIGKLDRTTWKANVAEFTYNFDLSEAIAVDTGKTLDLADQIMVKNYYKFTGGTPASAELLVWEDTTELTLDNVSYTLPMTFDGAEYLAIGNGLASNQYGKAVFSCAKFVDAQGVAHYSKIQCYTPEVYAQKMFEKNKNAKLMDLMEAMIFYGQAAVDYFGQG